MGTLVCIVIGAFDSVASTFFLSELLGKTVHAPNHLHPVPHSFHTIRMPSRYENTTVNLALEVLRTIVPSSSVKGETTALRLALRVMLPHIPYSPALTEFWTIATNKHRLVYQACIGPYLAIVAHLKLAGFEIDAANDLHSGRS